MKGKEFKTLLKSNNITQDNAAKMLHVARNTVSRWCKMEQLSREIEYKINDIFIKKGYKSLKEIKEFYVREEMIEYQKKSTDEKDNIITELKGIIENQKDIITNLKEQIETLKKRQEDVQPAKAAHAG